MSQRDVITNLEGIDHLLGPDSARHSSSSRWSNDIGENIVFLTLNSQSAGQTSDSSLSS